MIFISIVIIIAMIKIIKSTIFMIKYTNFIVTVIMSSLVSGDIPYKNWHVFMMTPLDDQLVIITIITLYVQGEYPQEAA